MTTLKQIYPYSYLNYNTLLRPNTITNYAFEKNPIQYDDNYTNEQLSDMKKGIIRYLYSSKEIVNEFPVYNSNIKPLKNNYLKY